MLYASCSDRDDTEVRVIGANALNALKSDEELLVVAILHRRCKRAAWRYDFRRNSVARCGEGRPHAMAYAMTISDAS